MFFDQTYWTFVAHTGRIPTTAPGNQLRAPGKPLALKQLTQGVFTTGADVLDPQMVADAVQANTLRIPRPVLKFPPLQGQKILSDALGAPKAIIAPTHLGMVALLQQKG